MPPPQYSLWPGAGGGEHWDCCHARRSWCDFSEALRCTPSPSGLCSLGAQGGVAVPGFTHTVWPECVESCGKSGREARPPRPGLSAPVCGGRKAA